MCNLTMIEIGDICREFRIDVLQIPKLKDFAELAGMRQQNLYAFENGKANNIQHLYSYMNQANDEQLEILLEALFKERRKEPMFIYVSPKLPHHKVKLAKSSAESSAGQTIEPEGTQSHIESMNDATSAEPSAESNKLVFEPFELPEFEGLQIVSVKLANED